MLEVFIALAAAVVVGCVFWRRGRRGRRCCVGIIGDDQCFVIDAHGRVGTAQSVLDDADMAAYCLIDACLHGTETARVAELLADARVHHATMQWVLQTWQYVRVGDTMSVPYFRTLFNHSFTPLTAALLAASNVDIVRLLLADGRANPAAKRSWALYIAAVKGRVEITRALLADGRADPHANSCMIHVMASSHIDVVRALLADGRYDRDSAAYAGWVFQQVAGARCSAMACAWFATVAQVNEH